MRLPIKSVRAGPVPERADVQEQEASSGDAPETWRVSTHLS